MVTEEEKDCGRKKAKSRSEGTGLETVDGWVQKSRYYYSESTIAAFPSRYAEAWRKSSQTPHSPGLSANALPLPLSYT